jgi:hypothetical protein
MNQIIEIENGLVRLVTRTVEHTVPLEDWMPLIEKRGIIRMPALPVGTRAVIWDPTDLQNQKMAVLIEQEPQIIGLRFFDDIHTVSLPYMRFFFNCITSDITNNIMWQLSDYRCFMAEHQYRNDEEEDMIAALLPNIYQDGRICFGSTAPDANQTIGDRLTQIVNEFWLSGFNNDLTIRRPNNARGWTQWERMTETDPTGWTNWRDWEPGAHGRFSFRNLASNVGMTSRSDEVIVPDAIPPLPLGASFGRVEEWIQSLNNGQRARLIQTTTALAGIQPEDFVAPATTDDDDDDD